MQKTPILHQTSNFQNQLQIPPHHKHCCFFYCTFLVMENSDLWGSLDDYSIFLPGDGDDLNLFGNYLLGVDFDFDQFLLPPTQDAFNPVVDSTPARSDFDTISPSLQHTATTYATDTSSNASSIDYPELSIPPLQTISDGQLSDPVEDRPEDSTQCHSGNEDQDNLSISMKRKIEDAIIVFSVNADTKVVPKRRKAYSKSRKREVARNRMVGACIPCKVRKGPVSQLACVGLNLWMHDAH